MSTKKIDKEFCFTDESVNVYGYRCLTSGLQLDEVKKNPIGFKMHNRDNGVVVRWEDFRIDGDKVYAKPVINLSHPQGESIVSEIENGFLNGASAGRIVCLEASDDVNLKIPGQTEPTVTKWFPREISLVDIPGNYNALSNLFDVNNNPLKLSDLSNMKCENSGLKFIVDESMMKALKLSSNASQTDFNTAIQNLIKTSTKTVDQKKSDENKDLNDVPNELQNKSWDELYATDKLQLVRTNHPHLYDKLKDEKFPQKASLPTPPVQNLEVPNDLKNKTWDELYSTGKLEVVRTKHPQLYEQLRAEKYPKNKN